MNGITPLAAADWLVIALFFLVTLGIGLFFSRKATSSLADYFVAGRKMTWWLAGTSIVATSFAADTPLVIAGWMRTSGLERNWFWWGGIMGMMLCTFFFARLWRRANILTDVEFNEIRYSGKPAAGLRIFHAGYRALIQNTLVMGWVTLAMTKILAVTLNIPTLVFTEGSWIPQLVPAGVDVTSVVDMASVSTWPVVGAAVIPAKITGIVICLTVAVAYSAISGLWGVVATDFFQFTLAMTGTVVLMVFSFNAAGGPSRMVADATRQVESGAVLNSTPLNRAQPPMHRAYADAGLTIESEDGTWQWNAQDLNEHEVRDRLGRNADLGPWKRAYTISRIQLHDQQAVARLLEHKILVRDVDAAGRPLDYYRLPDASISEASLRAAVEAAGVDNPGDFLAAWRGDRVVQPIKLTRFLPPFDLKGGGLVAVWSLIVFLGLQWWSGGEGGGFLAQRLFSCKNEKHSVLAMLWFNFLNYAVRPWPWIVVGIASLVLMPDITVFGAGFDEEHAYVLMLMKYLPVGLKGLLVASLMAAYMSTISTHVNFGASYVVNDLYKRFLRKHGTEKGDIRVSQIASVLLAVLAGIYALMSENIATGWFTMFELMSGVGLVVLLRWYWWRVNAWAELAAMGSSLTLFSLLNWTPLFHTLFKWIGAPVYLLDEYAVRFTMNIVFTSIVWVSVMFLTKPEPEAHLLRFYQRIRPPGWWSAIADKAGHPKHLRVGLIEWACWTFGVTGLFAMIISIGKLCLGMPRQSAAYAIFAILAVWIILRLIRKMDWSETVEETA